MRTVEELNKRKIPIVTIDSSLEEYKDRIICPDKLDKANKMLETAKLPKSKRRSWLVRRASEKWVPSVYKFPNVNKELGPEMKSTGEAIYFIDDLMGDYFLNIYSERNLYLSR